MATGKPAMRPRRMSSFISLALPRPPGLCEPSYRGSDLSLRASAGEHGAAARGDAAEQQHAGGDVPRRAAPAAGQKDDEQGNGQHDRRSHHEPGSPGVAMLGHDVDPMHRRLSIAELLMTERLESAIAAAAMIGFSRPAAAMGIAAVL